MHRLIVHVGAGVVLASITLGAACTSKGASTSAPNHGPAPAAGIEVVDEDAVAILKGAAALLRDADSLQVELRTGFDVVQNNGQRIEFGATRQAAIQRPDRARFEFVRRDGKQGVVVFDGNDIWVHLPKTDVYAHTPQPGGIDESIRFLTEELGVTAPLADLFTSDVGSTLAKGLSSCYVVGDSTVSGTACHQVAARNDYADFQIWVAKGDQPLLQRIVITYREEPGQPQFWADFSDWSIGNVADSRTFVFQPPEGSERILFQSVRSQAGTPSQEGE